MARRTLDVYTEWRGGTCRVKWWTGEYLPSGRKRFESEGGFDDEDEALKHGMAKLTAIRDGSNISNRDASTLMDDWLDTWLTGLDHGHLTEEGYDGIVRNHIRPYFTGKAVADVDVLVYRAFRKHLHSKEYAPGKLLAPSTIKNIMGVLNMVLDDAAPKLIKTSPVERKRPRGRYRKAKKRERKKDMLIEHVDRLARNAEILMGLSGYVLVWMIATTGMRPGELYGLTREYCYPAWPASDLRLDDDETDRYDDDLDRYGKGGDRMPAVRVERQVQYKKGKLGFFPPKYDSYRTLVIPPFLARMLETVLASHDSNWVMVALQGGGLGHITFHGKWWGWITGGAEERQGYWARPEVKPVAAYLGKRFYLLRHGHKSWLDADGHSEFAKEHRMGHEMPGSAGTYSTVTVEEERAIMKKLQRRWDRHIERMHAEALIANSRPVSQ
ncbi:hypothetical protein GCM10010331_49990 [Streptomyces xanthochromogenes]|uniref:integrase n=1 Tax=Streptomyces xanthochromogenes TaxID=67384 RepID=UPI0016740AC8|nr:integrase [Streptomyces xanthochromogenes]GHB56088.1 hypothetical protein GCM10010331_49990 [Streptomyces xanthochromogenes]